MGEEEEEEDDREQMQRVVLAHRKQYQKQHIILTRVETVSTDRFSASLPLVLSKTKCKEKQRDFK